MFFSISNAFPALQPGSVPDLLVDGVLQKTHVLLDKQQLELVKGLIDKNLGEPIEQFETPNTVIKDPVGPVSVCGHMRVA